MVALSPVYGSRPADQTVVREISTADLRWALSEGWRDYKDRRGEALVLGFIYPVVGLMAAVFAANQSLFPLIFPLVAGLSLMGPVVASGFYELARRREAGEDTRWRHALEPFIGPSGPSILALGLALAGLFTAWLAVAWGIYALTLGTLAPASSGQFLGALFGTPEGWAMIILGNLAGLVFAIIALAFSLVSFPMVVDRRGHVFAAVATSLEACAKNPKATVTWGLMVAGLLVLAAIPLLVGLAIVLPVLGYATWHLYTRLVVRGPQVS